MEPESHASAVGPEARLTRARNIVDSSAVQIKNSLGSIIALTGTPPPTNQPLWRRLDVFERADLDDNLSAAAQADIAHDLRPLVSLHDRLAHARWTISTASDSPPQDGLAGHGGGITTATTIGSIELLAEVFTIVSSAVESLATRLTAKTVFGAPIPISEPAYVREIRAGIARVSTDPDAAWTWESHLDPNDPR